MDNIQELQAALEAKDAEIASREAIQAELVRQGAYLGDCITSLERQLAEAQTVIAQLDERSAQYERLLIAETERCARIADDFGASAENKIESDPKSAKLILAAEANAAGIIAAAIRGSAKVKLTESEKRRNLLRYYAEQNDKQILPPTPRQEKTRSGRLLADGLIKDAGFSSMWGTLYAITDLGRAALAQHKEK